MESDMASRQRFRKDWEELRNTQPGESKLNVGSRGSIRQILPKKVLRHAGVDLDEPGSVEYLYYRDENIFAIDLSTANKDDE